MHSGQVILDPQRISSPSSQIKSSADREPSGTPLLLYLQRLLLSPPSGSEERAPEVRGNFEPGQCLFCLCTVALSSCFLSQFARNGALDSIRGPRREPGWRCRRGHRLWFVRGRDCISKDPPFSPRHHHHSSAASPTAEPRPQPPPPPPPVTSPFLLLPPRPALQSSAHPHIRGNLPPAPPTFKRTPGVPALTGGSCPPYHPRTRHTGSRDTCGFQGRDVD